MHILDEGSPWTSLKISNLTSKTMTRILKCYLGIFTGLQSWDVEASGIDINAELQSFASAAPSGEEGPNGK